MKLRDLASCVVVDPRKLTEYALSHENPRGRHKARVFEAALGYNQDNYQSLLEQIEVLALDAEAVVEVTTEPVAIADLSPGTHSAENPNRSVTAASTRLNP